MRPRLLFLWHLIRLSLAVLLRWVWLGIRDRMAPSTVIPPPDRQPLVLLYSQVAWFGVWQRPQELAVGLARRGRRVLYVAPMQVHERIGRYAGSQTRLNPPEHPNLTVFSPLILSGEYRWGWIFRLNKRLIAAELRQQLRGEPPVDLFCNTPLGEPLIEAIPHRRFVYDVMDDYSAFDWAPAGAQAMERRLLARADAVFTGTHALLESVRPTRPDATFVACGVHFDRFHRPVNAPEETEPADIRDLPPPRIGYVGTLSERIDVDLLRRLAEAFPQASLVLIGPVYRTLGEPPPGPNIHYLGLKRHEELAGYMRNFDVALLPFRLIPAVMAIHPVKMLEYLAAGCVVVSTAIPDVKRFYAEVALIAETTEEFVEKTRQALAEDQTERRRRGIERARECSWEAMVEAMAGALEG